MEYTSIMSYGRFLKDRAEFRRSGTRHGSDFNLFDTPSQKYFKILFYFGVDDGSTDDVPTGGLLSPTWNIKNIDNKYYNYNSAWAYLKMNDENERAEKLEHFVNLLSNINSNSPWYFSTVGGLQDAIERKVASDGKFEMPDSRKLTITCLPDAFDNRITTLLDLYRDITWSWHLKREILPVNLRKFDMAIYIFESPLHYWHDDDNRLDINNNLFRPSYKMFEFHNCEFDYNSIKSGWNELNNTTGFAPTYTIDIKYDDVYEISWNELMMRTIGDIITTDIWMTANSVAQQDSSAQLDYLKTKLSSTGIGNNTPDNDDRDVRNQKVKYKKRNFKNGDDLGIIPMHEGSKNHDAGLVGNALKQVFGQVKTHVKSKINRALLGNLHTYSLTQIGSQIKSALQGNLIPTAQAAKDYVKEANERNAIKPTANGNIYAQQKAAMKVKAKGNIFKDVTIVNNI